MIQTLRFTVPGEPRGKGRPRFRKAAGFVQTYTDAETASYENLIRLAAVQALAGMPMLDGPIDVQLRIVRSIPSGFSRKKAAAALAGRVRPLTAPDADNVLKAVLDATNGVAFKDDKQVCDFRASKWYGREPRLDVVIRQIEVPE